MSQISFALGVNKKPVVGHVVPAKTASTPKKALRDENTLQAAHPQAALLPIAELNYTSNKSNKKGECENSLMQ